MVVRAYAFHALIPGIIVDEEREVIKPDPELPNVQYEQLCFTVAWSDGVMTSELVEELDYLDGTPRGGVAYEE